MATFGDNSTSYANYMEFPEDAIVLRNFTTPSDMGTLTQIECYMRRGSAGSQKAKCAVFKASDNSLVGVGPEVTISESAYTWKAWSGLSLALQPSTAYRFGLWYGPITSNAARWAVGTGGGGYVSYDSSGGDYSAGGNPTSPYAEESGGDVDARIILTYTPAATSVGNAAGLLWHTRAAVGDAVQAVWHQRQAVGDAVQALWHVRAAARGSLSLPWHVRAAVGQESELLWDVLAIAAVGLDIDLRWNVRSVVGDPLQALWHVRAPMGKSADVRWHTRALAGDTLQGLWHTRAAVGQASDLRWNVRAAVGDELSLLWNVLGQVSVGQAVSLSWNTRAVAGDALNARWSVRTTVTRESEYVWNVRISAGAQTVLEWKVRGTAGKTARFIWNTLSDRIIAEHVLKLLASFASATHLEADGAPMRCKASYSPAVDLAAARPGDIDLEADAGTIKLTASL